MGNAFSNFFNTSSTSSYSLTQSGATAKAARIIGAARAIKGLAGKPLTATGVMNAQWEVKKGMRAARELKGIGAGIGRSVIRGINRSKKNISSGLTNEFAPLFGPFMKELNITDLPREKFIETFIEKIEAKKEEDKTKTEKEKLTAISNLYISFKKALTNNSLTKNNGSIIKQIEKVIAEKDEEIKEREEEREKAREKKFPSLSEESYNELIQEIVVEKKKLETAMKPLTDFIGKVHKLIQDPNILTDQIKLKELEIELKKGKPAIKKENITSARIFIELNLKDFMERLDKEIEGIKQRKINSETNKRFLSSEEIWFQKINPIISDHKKFLNNLNIIFDVISDEFLTEFPQKEKDSNTSKAYKESTKEDIDKLIEMSFILQKIVDEDGYDRELKDYGKNPNQPQFFKDNIIEFKKKLEKFYINLITIVPKTKNQTKYSMGINMSTNIPYQSGLQFDQKFLGMRKKIMDGKDYDMDKLQSEFNRLLAELYNKYDKIKRPPNGQPPKISGILPPETLDKSISYRKLILFIIEFLRKLEEDNIKFYSNIMYIKVKVVDVMNEKKGEIGKVNLKESGLSSLEEDLKEIIETYSKHFKESKGFAIGNQAKKLKKENLELILDSIEKSLGEINIIKDIYLPDENFFEYKSSTLLTDLGNALRKFKIIIDDYFVKIIKIKKIIDIFYKKIKGSNYNQITYNKNSPNINKTIGKLSGFLNKKNSNKNSYENKSNTDLKAELNKLLDEIYTKFYNKPDDKWMYYQVGNIGNIGNKNAPTTAPNAPTIAPNAPTTATNVQKTAPNVQKTAPNATTTATNAPTTATNVQNNATNLKNNATPAINSQKNIQPLETNVKNNATTSAPTVTNVKKITPPAANGNNNNIRSVASTKDGNSNQSLINNRELPPFKANKAPPATIINESRPRGIESRQQGIESI